jgi:hypothetical protein
MLQRSISIEAGLIDLSDLCRRSAAAMRLTQLLTPATATVCRKRRRVVIVLPRNL